MTVFRTYVARSSQRLAARVYRALIAVVALSACAGILGLRRDQQAMFPHRAHVVAGVSCTRCHTAFTPNDGNRLHLPDDASCVTCHTKPHDTRPCSQCHSRPTGIAELVEARDHLKFDHTRHLSRTVGNCVRCHSGVATDEARLRPTMATCFRCHDRDAERDGRRCDACHRDLTTERTLPVSHLAHDGDWLREHGARAASSGELCESCHQPSSCASCHGQTTAALPARLSPADPMQGSVHRAGFAARHSREGRSDPGACAMCHSPDRCLACHTAKGIAGRSDRSPHPPGWVGLTGADNAHGREARRDPAGCASCHGGAGEALCVSCHAVGGVGGNPHPPGFSSRLPMTALPCRLCHRGAGL